jgi:nitrite reductase/ring-hydroxylating ferredoxin subunit
MAELITVASVDELKSGECKVIQVNGQALALYNVAGRFYATSNTCLHRGGPLGEGELQNTIITCPWHGWQFDVGTGENVLDTASKLKTYEVQVVGNNVQIRI